MNLTPYDKCTDFVLCESAKFDLQCKEGYTPHDCIKEPVKPPNHLQGQSSSSYVWPRRKLPQTLQQHLSKDRAIYRFEIYSSPGDKCPELYIGKAACLESRMQDYVEMTRRAIALYSKRYVRVDKNGLRFVHYRIARALIKGGHVKLCWYRYPCAQGDGQTLEREEQRQIAEAICEYTAQGGCGYGKVLNGMDAFKSLVHRTNLECDWEDVWRQVQTDPDKADEPGVHLK